MSHYSQESFRLLCDEVADWIGMNFEDGLKMAVITVEIVFSFLGVGLPFAIDFLCRMQMCKIIKI